jgi:hypothetical protein
MARRAQGEGGSFFHAGPPHLQQEGCSYELASTLPEHGIRIGTIPVAQRRVRRVPACAGGVGAPPEHLISQLFSTGPIAFRCHSAFRL